MVSKMRGRITNSLHVDLVTIDEQVPALLVRCNRHCHGVTRLHQVIGCQPLAQVAFHRCDERWISSTPTAGGPSVRINGTPQIANRLHRFVGHMFDGLEQVLIHVVPGPPVRENEGIAQTWKVLTLRMTNRQLVQVFRSYTRRESRRRSAL